MAAAPKISNRPDEWKIEQGMLGGALPPLDMRAPRVVPLENQTFGDLTKDEEAIKEVGDRSELFKAERKGWKG